MRRRTQRGFFSSPRRWVAGSCRVPNKLRAPTRRMTRLGLLPRSSPRQCVAGSCRVLPSSHGGWRCDRHRRRKAGQGAACRTAGVPSRHGAARCAAPAAACPRPCHDKGRNLAADGKQDEVSGQHESYQSTLGQKSNALRSVGEGSPKAQEGRWQQLVIGYTAYRSRSCQVADEASGVGSNNQGCPDPRAYPLTVRQVVLAVNQHAAHQAEGCTNYIQDRGKGLAVEPRCKGRLVPWVCEGAREVVHLDVSLEEVHLEVILHLEVRAELARGGCEECRRWFLLHRDAPGPPVLSRQAPRAAAAARATGGASEE
eukprot:scaffold4044_cov78-Phaeocystis_antarctica.AAC.4